MNDPDPGEMRDHYEFGPESKPVRGKYAAAYRRGTNIVLIEPDLMAHYGSPQAINETLRKAAAGHPELGGECSKPSSDV